MQGVVGGSGTECVGEREHVLDTWTGVCVYQFATKCKVHCFGLE